MAFIALYDACVLYPAPLRDLLVRLAMTGLFQAKWTNQILDECFRNVLLDRPELTLEKLERTRALMNSAVRDCLVEGHETLIDGLTLPDSNDRHVLAAAIRSSAQVIVTSNLKDFPADALDPYDIEAQKPDVFVEHQLDLSWRAVCHVVEQQLEALKNPPNKLEAQGLSRSVRRLRTQLLGSC